MYVRFVTSERDPDSDQPRGIFAAAYELERRDELAPHELAWFAELDRWFTRHLRRPTRFAWSRRPHAPGRAISWLKLSAAEHVRRLREIAKLLRARDVPVEEFQTAKPGYVL